MPKIWQDESWAKKLPYIWKAKRESLVSFGSKLNAS
jgi:hypothetical protein